MCEVWSLALVTCGMDYSRNGQFAAPPAEVGTRVLVIDDGLVGIKFVQSSLSEDCEIIYALDGTRGLEMARTHQPDLILLDVLMPGLDGWEVSAALRADPATADIPLIFITALSSAEAETRALEAGAADFISKPVNPAVLRARVRTHLTLKRQSDRLRALTFTDSLTGIPNRRAFEAALERAWRRCLRACSPLSLALLDVDHFKAYNDRYGHPAGDACLRLVAAQLMQCAARSDDLAARHGGEEFALLLPGTELIGAEGVARAVIEAVDGLGISQGGSPPAPHVTVSIGVACAVPAQDLAPGGLVALADRLLYLAKNGGRHRAVGQYLRE